MANKHKSLVTIELDKVRKIRYTLNALAEIEEKLGAKLDQLDKIDMGIKELRTFLWAGLIHEDAELTEREVGNLVDFDNMEYINQKITEAFQSATGKN